MNHLDKTRAGKLVPENSNVGNVHTQLLHGILSVGSDTEFPIDSKKKEIIEAIKTGDELIIVAETGAGKSTRVPQFLYEAGYNVIVTQPRVLAAVSLARHVADEMNTPLGDIVGYHTGGGKAHNKVFSDNTKIKYCTDGLQVVKQLVDNSISTKKDAETVLVIDEVHEWNKNIEVLLARVKKMKTQGEKIKVICMSATLDADRLQDFLSTNNDHSAKKIEVHGRLFPVSVQEESENSIISIAIDFVRKGRNILIFQPGKKEIQECINELSQLNVNAVILPLHGELSADEQQLIYNKYDKPVIIVSTNIAQTSVTIPYIDAVIDSGKERRIELINGVETLVLGNISKADSKQRKGRAGRCKEGIYVLGNDNGFDGLSDYPIPEIQRTRVDLNYIRILASTGLKMEELDFFHPINPDNIQQAKNTLTLLGAIDEKGHATMIGKKLSMLPTDVNTGKMILEALKYGCLRDILIISAIRQAKGIIEHRSIIRDKNQDIFVGSIPNECIDRDSDLITQLNLCTYAFEHNITERSDLAKIGINAKSYYKTQEIYEQIYDTLHASRYDFEHFEHKIGGKSKKEALLLCITAGMLDTIRARDSYSSYYDKNRSYKEFDNKSKVIGGKLIVATPKTIEFETKRGKMKKELIHEVTNITPEILKEVAPHLITKTENPSKRDTNLQKFVFTQDDQFNGLKINSEERESPVSNTTIKEYAKILAQGGYYLLGIDIRSIVFHNGAIQDKLSEIDRRTGGTRKGKKIPTMDLSELTNFYFEILYAHKVHSTEDFKKFIENHGNELLMLNPPNILLPDYNKIFELYPDTIQVSGRDVRIGYYGGEIIVYLGDTDLDNINDNDFVRYFEGKPYRFSCDGNIFDSIDAGKKILRERNIRKDWHNFLQSKTTVAKSFESRNGEYTIKKDTYNKDFGLECFSAPVVAHDKKTRQENRFLDKTDAEKEVEKTQLAFKDYLYANKLRNDADTKTTEVENRRSNYLDNITDKVFDNLDLPLQDIIKKLDETRDNINSIRSNESAGDITNDELQTILNHIGEHKKLEKEFEVLNAQQTPPKDDIFASHVKNLFSSK